MSMYVKLIDHPDVLTVSEEAFVIWNRFFPVLLKLNKAGMDFVNSLKNRRIEVTEENKPVIDLLLKYKIVVEGDSDPSKEDFLQSVEDALAVVRRNGEAFYNEGSHYSKLDITTDQCNLGCRYCVNEHKRCDNSRYISVEEKEKRLNQVVDQHFSALIRSGVTETMVAFNGGEFLLEWPLMEKMVRRICHKYPKVAVKYAMNTNMSVMSKEIAEFLDAHQFEVYISIDGYKTIHDKTRIFKNGSGSYDRIMKNLDTYSKYNKAYPIKGFQGTIDMVEGFDPGEVYKMKEHGFIEARLAPNLLGTTEDDAVKKAGLMGTFLRLNNRQPLQVIEQYFDNMKRIINSDDYRFFFNCHGMAPRAKMMLALNVSTLNVSHMCSYIPQAALDFEELGYDIFNPKLWEVSYRFVRQRVDALLEHCIECPMISICRGGCIYTGLDKENQLNTAACAYQKELWKIYVKRVHRDNC